MAVVFSSSSITVTDADCAPDPVTEEPVIPFTDAELTAALSIGMLTADHCVWMEEQGISWEINVERQ